MKFYEFVEEVFAAESGGRKPAKLFIGEPDLPTPKIIAEAGVKAVRQGRTKYVSSQGLVELRKKIARKHDAKCSQVVVTPGSKFAVFSAVKMLAGNAAGKNNCNGKREKATGSADGKGAEVVIPSPHWPGFEAICEREGAKAKLVPASVEDDWEISAEKLGEAIGDKTRLVILCNPNNPTSTMMSKKAAGEIVKVANERNVPILIDEAYRGIAFAPMENQADASNPLCITAGSFSKGFSMTGWRAGYLVASEEIASRTVSLAQ